MSEKLEKILQLVEEFVEENNSEWSVGDWINYSGPVFDKNEYTEAIKVLLNGWLIFGENCRDFEKLRDMDL